MRKTEFSPALSPDDAFSGADDLTVLDIEQVCKFFGGPNSPIHPTTYYRGVKRGIYPPPFKQGPGISRCTLGQCRTYLRKMLAGVAA